MTTPHADWLSSDPRNELVDLKHASIIILRPHSGGKAKWECGTGYVETKHGWSIRTSFESHPSIDKWDTNWLWTLSP